MTADQYINGKAASQARRRVWFTWAPLIAGICLLMQVSQALAGSFTLMPPNGFQRQSGQPVTEAVSFNALDPGAVYTLYVYNGGLEDHELTGEHVSSSTITLNGASIFGPSDFNQNVDTLSTAVTLQSSNELDVTLMGKPGGVITILIIGEDNVAPTITASVSPPANAAGWHQSDVTIDFQCFDTTSGIASCPDSLVVSTEGAAQVFGGTAIDNAGNTASVSVTLNLDKTLPTINPQTDVAANAVGWHRAPVEVSFDCQDTLSGVASCTAPVNVSAEVAGQVVNGSATDIAGNTASASLTLNIDFTPPTLNTQRSSEPNAAGWYNQSVVFDITCSDALSGVQSCPVQQILSLDGAGQVISVTALDNADNPTTVTHTVNIDRVSPVLQFMSPTPGELIVDKRPQILLMLYDLTLDEDSLALTVNGAAFDGSCVIAGNNATCTPDSDLPAGDILLVASVGDLAGNSASNQVAFRIDLELDAVTGVQTAQQGQQIVVSWDPHPDSIVTGYYVDRSAYGENSWQRLNTVAQVDTNYADDTAQNGNSYDYRVYAVDVRDIESRDSAIASQFLAFNDRSVAQASIDWGNYRASLGWTLALEANESVRIYRGDLGTGDIAYQDTASAYIDLNSHWAVNQRYQVVSVLSFDNLITGLIEQREGPAVELLLSALPPITVELADVDPLGAYSWQVESATGVPLTIVGTVANAIAPVGVNLVSGAESLATTVSNQQFQFLLRDAQHEIITISLLESGAPADRNVSLTLAVIADNTPLTLQLDNPALITTEAGSINVSGRVLNVDGGVSQLSASSDRFPGLDFGLTLVENNEFFGELPLEFGDNQLQVRVVAANGGNASANFDVDRSASAVPAIQFTSHSPNQVVDQPAITLGGRLYSSLDADEIQLRLNGDAVAISPVQSGVYAFTHPGIALNFGFNQIVAQAQTPLGSNQAAIVIYFQDSQSDPDQPLALELTTPNDQQIVNDDTLLVRGQLLNAGSDPQVLVNGVPMALFGSSQRGWLFNTGIDISALTEGDVSVTVDASSTGKSPLQVIRSVTVDRVEPALAIDNVLLDPPTVNEITESPLRISGSVSDTNLAAVTINGQPVSLTPDNGPNSYLFNSSLLLPLGQQATIDLVAIDRAGNEASLNYEVLSNPGPVVEVIQPLADSEYLVFNNSQLIETIARVNNAPADSTLTVEAGAVSSQQTVTQEIISTNLAVDADESIEQLRFILRDVNGDTLASQSVPITIVDAANIPLELQQTVPQQGDGFREPHFPVQFYFNRPVALADLTINVRETVHGLSYSSERKSGASLGEMYQGDTVEVHKDQAPVAGALSLLPGERIVEFYPATDLSYGARVFVSLSYQGSQLARFFYDVRSNPTFVKASLFDQLGQGIPGIDVSLPALGLEGSTDSNGTLMLGSSAPASQVIETGLYRMLLNPDQKNPRYGTRDLKVQITGGIVNQFTGLRLPELSGQIAYRYLQSGVASNVMAGGDLQINTLNARIGFPNGQADGQVHVQLVTYSDGLYSVENIELAPLWMYNLQPGPIRVSGEIGLDIAMPTLYGGHDYAPPNGSRVLLMGLDHDSGLIEAIGVGRIDALRVISEGRVHASRLDYIGYQFISEQHQELARRYADGEIGLDALEQGILGR